MPLSGVQYTSNITCNFEFKFGNLFVMIMKIIFITEMIKQLRYNTPYFIVCEATCFGPYMTIIRPSCESSPKNAGYMLESQLCLQLSPVYISIR
jgi:hypothetical protein